MNEELDELASAYVDGEASPDEMARVESDPQLLSLVEEFRALRQSSLPAPQFDVGLQEQHISAALAAFDELHAAKPSLMAVDDSASQSPTRRADDRSTDQRSPDQHSDNQHSDNTVARQSSSVGDEPATVTSLDARRSRRRPPTWLLNAAAAVVVVGGVGFAATQLPDSSGEDAAVQTLDDADLEAEAADVSSASGASQASNSAASDEGADSTATQLADTDPTEDEQASDDAVSDEAMSDEASDEAMSDEDSDSAEEDRTGEAAPPTEFFEGVETASEVLEALGGPQSVATGDLDLSPPDDTPCFELTDIDGEPMGFVSVGYGETLGLLLVFDVAGTPTPVLVDQTCVVLSAG